MNNQEVFDTVAKHLLTQKQISANLAACLYRGHSGLKCAIGCLIPDELYDPAMDDSSSNTGIEETLCEFPQIRTLFNGVDERLLSELQLLHDQFDVSEWIDRLRSITRKYILDASVLHQFQGT